MPRAYRLNRVDGTPWGIGFECPGCRETHGIRVKGGPRADGDKQPEWEWNGSLERPTLAPSILVHESKRTDGTIAVQACHSFVRDGRIEFLGDSGHALAGQTVDLPETSG